jgi:UTP-glucose-1-phosphate uridylyltransferase
VYPGHLEGDEYVIDRIPGKGEREGTFDTGGRSSAFTGVGRYVFDSDVFDLIDTVERSLPPGTELDDVPVMQRLLSAGGLTGRRIKGKFFDVGLISGYEEATREYGD